jgi:Aspartyl protease
VVNFFKHILISIAFATATKASAHPAARTDSVLSPAVSIVLLNIASVADSSTFIVPFSRAGNLILVQAKADTTEGNFILDTGCPHLVLNLTYFRNYPTHNNDEERNGITGAEFAASQTTVASFSFGAARYYSMQADLANLGNIENSKGVKILGLIGMELLNKFEMIIDYEKNLIYLHRISRKEASSYRHEMLRDESAFNVVPITITDSRIMIQTVLAGKKIKLIIDSGAETNLLDSRLPDKIFENVSITGRSILSGAGNTKIEVLRGDLKTLMIGTQAIESLPVLITNLEKTCFSYGGCVDGILGFDFLSLKKIGFNFVTNKMYIWK